MKLTRHERERLLVYVAAELGRRRRENGVKLNYPETVAIITDEMAEAARAGHSYDEVLAVGREAVSKDDVMYGVPDMIDTVQVEATFPEGTKLVTLADPFLA
jgi:urease gamma subunit